MWTVNTSCICDRIWCETMKKSLSIVAFIIVFCEGCVFSEVSVNFSKDEKYFEDEYQKTNTQSDHYQPHTQNKIFIPKSKYIIFLKQNHPFYVLICRLRGCILLYIYYLNFHLLSKVATKHQLNQTMDGV